MKQEVNSESATKAPIAGWLVDAQTAPCRAAFAVEAGLLERITLAPRQSLALVEPRAGASWWLLQPKALRLSMLSMNR